MPAHFLLRPHGCHPPNHYNAIHALKIALSIDTVPGSSYRNPHSKRTSSSQAPRETTAAIPQTVDRRGRIRPNRLVFHSRPNHDADVFVHNLQATLDAHRTTNRASIIHHVKSENTDLLPFQRLELNYHLSVKTPESPITSDAKTSAHIQNPEISHVGSEYLNPQAIAEGKLQGQHDDVPQKRTAVGPPQRSKRVPKQSGQTDALSLSRSGEDIGEYVGLSLWPAHQWSLHLSSIERPWLDYHQGKSGDGYSRLRAEILAFHEFMSPTPDESAAYKSLIDDLQDHAREILPDNPTEVVGSHRTGLATSLSDLDFRLSLPEHEKPVNERGPSPTRPEARKASVRKLRKLMRGLSATKDYENIELRHGRIPIISGVHRATQLTVQIQALTDSSASREYVLNYLAEFPTLQPLYTLIKTTLEIRNLRDVHVGGLGAYSIFMLVVAALRKSEGAISRNDIASQLLSALEFYAETDLYRHGISVDPPGLFRKVHGTEPPKHPKGATLADPILHGQARIARVNEKQPYLLCMQDPANSLNDLGAKAYNIKHVQALFRVAKSKLSKLFQKFDHLSPLKDKSDRWTQSAMLDPLVGANYCWFQSRRARIAQWGRVRSQDTPSVRKLASRNSR